MLRHLAKPHGIVAVIMILFAAAWAVWTFYWLPQAEFKQIEAPPPGAQTTP